MGQCTADRSTEVSNVQTGLALSRVMKALPPSLQQMTLEEIYEKNISKYYNQRYDLFQRYDEGIMLDYESWFSVTPEIIAKHIARQMACHTIVDACCGAGGNAIQFALICQRVIAIEIDPIRIQIARHNAKIYGVDHLIEFICGDAFKVLPSLKEGSIDAVFLSPPWGGPDYKLAQQYDLGLFLKFADAARKVTPNIALMFPRTINKEEVRDQFGPCKFLRNHVRQKTKAILAYFGDFAKPHEPKSPPRSSTESIGGSTDSLEPKSPTSPAQKKMKSDFYSDFQYLSPNAEA